LFSDEAIKQKRNTEAIEVAPNTLVAARIAEYKPAGQRPLAELRAEIGTILRREQAGRLAVQQGESDLAELRQGRPVASLKFGRPAKLDRQGVQGFAEAETRAAFQLPAKALPGYAGVAGDAGYTILRVAPASVVPERAAEMAQMVPVVLQRGYATLLGEAYVDSLKQHASINVRNELLEKAER
jgi:peptidyl-prolyl cis-trans isomerase D